MNFFGQKFGQTSIRELCWIAHNPTNSYVFGSKQYAVLFVVMVYNCGGIWLKETCSQETRIKRLRTTIEDDCLKYPWITEWPSQEHILHCYCILFCYAYKTRFVMVYQTVGVAGYIYIYIDCFGWNTTINWFYGGSPFH